MVKYIRVLGDGGSVDIPDIADGWSIQLPTSPTEQGGQSRPGSGSFSTIRDEDSKFLIDNRVRVRSDTAGVFNGFDGVIRETSLSESTVDLGVNNIMTKLDVERTAGINVAGTRERTFKVPLNVPYVVDGVTYYTGEAQGFQPIIPSAIEADFKFVYAYCEVDAYPFFAVFDPYGNFQGISPDWVAGDTPFDYSTRGTWLLSQRPSPNYVLVASTKRNNIRKYAGDVFGGFALTYDSTIGSAGSGNGQFNGISGLAGDGFGVYTSEVANGRIQRFNVSTLAYISKWGTPGASFAGDYVFNTPNNIMIGRNGYLLVPDYSGRVRQYDPFTGVYVPGGLNTRLDVRGLAPNRPTYLTQGWDRSNNGQMTYVTNGSVTYEYSQGLVYTGRRWGSPITSNSGLLGGLTAFNYEGAMFQVNFAAGGVDRITGSLGTVRTYIAYYIALAAPDLPLNFVDDAVLDNPAGMQPFIAWRGNVWQMLCDLLAVSGYAITMIDDLVTVYNLRPQYGNFPYINLPNNIQVGDIEHSTRSAGNRVVINNLNTFQVTDTKMMYSAFTEDNRTFTADQNDLYYVRVKQNTYPTYLKQPIIRANDAAYATDADSGYVVYDANNLQVSTTAWNNSGAEIRADISENPGEIIIRIIGPKRVMAGYTAPYRIGVLGYGGFLKVAGIGIIANPELLEVGTGVNDQSRDTVASIDTPFIVNRNSAYSQAAWISYHSGVPDSTVTISFDIAEYVNIDAAYLVQAFANGSLVLYDEAYWIVRAASFNAHRLTLELQRHTSVTGDPGRGTPSFEEIWGGVTSGEFDDFWGSHPAQDVTIAPLRNPFGLNVYR